ncbi:hypothetical protein [Streptomyces telluris]|uniref:Uncharacterized protein n=1 Tax=Streptomyces telluris TaxID=2720021 RepID=A0A9X2RQQ0_9ACTN|nr:hypothetical protein [Streptomyces telluris]MCQ8775048.1 hypothetical protein [Streptomyces telluris]NJP82337.1 hypothetical protein [Streptomyces telluris]
MSREPDNPLNPTRPLEVLPVTLLRRPRAITTLAAAATTLLSVATPASASSSACSHDRAGAQACSRLDGPNEWNAVTRIWTNPPASEKTRTMCLYWNGKRFSTVTARRVGKPLSYTWSSMNTGTDTTLCIKIKGSRHQAARRPDTSATARRADPT